MKNECLASAQGKDDAALTAEILSVLQNIKEAGEKEDGNGEAQQLQKEIQKPFVKPRYGITAEELYVLERALREQSRNWSYSKDGSHGYILKRDEGSRQRLVPDEEEEKEQKWGALHIMEIFFLCLKENREENITLARASRQLHPDEVFLYRPRWCFYYWRCMTYAADAGFRSFVCVKCPRFDFKGSLKKAREADLPERNNPPGTLMRRPQKMSKTYEERFLQQDKLNRLGRKVVREQKKPSATPAPPPPAEEKRTLKFITSGAAKHIFPGEDAEKRGKLALIEIFALLAEEAPGDKIRLGRLSRRLWTDESPEHLNKPCEYFARCVEFSVARKFPSFSCALCPRMKTK